jgi:hypothetical protein
MQICCRRKRNADDVMALVMTFAAVSDDVYRWNVEHGVSKK